MMMNMGTKIYYYSANNQSTMKKLLVLVAVGVAVKYFLDSEKGDEVKTYVKDLLGDAREFLNDFFEKATEKVENTASALDKKLMM